MSVIKYKLFEYNTELKQYFENSGIFPAKGNLLYSRMYEELNDAWGVHSVIPAGQILVLLAHGDAWAMFELAKDVPFEKKYLSESFNVSIEPGTFMLQKNHTIRNIDRPIEFDFCRLPFRCEVAEYLRHASV